MFHRNVVPADNHGIVSWVVADDAAKLALSLSSSDIGRVVLVQAPFDIEILENNVGPVWQSFFGAAGTIDAEDVNVVDAGGFYTGVEVEDILQEIGGILEGLGDQVLQQIPIAISDEATNLAAGTNKVIFHMAYDFDLSEVIAGVSVAQTAGSILQFDINVNSSSILSTKLTIDNSEKTSITAATPAVISSGTLNKGDEIAIDIDTVGTPLAKGAKIYMIGKVRP